ncbi:MAG: DUF86 domain-containing protein [Deltaproteobacteria bacterium]|nr:DUF86 domain-containing protein [Deltaproteobacteria bacterium]
MSNKKRDYILFLEDILQAIEKIEIYIKDLSYDEFCGNSMVTDAVIRNFEVIGEATKNIPKKIKERYPDVEWKEAAGFRDVLIHDYFGIDLEAVWDTIKINIPSFKKHMVEVLKNEQRANIK